MILLAKNMTSASYGTFTLFAVPPHLLGQCNQSFQHAFVGVDSVSDNSEDSVVGLIIRAINHGHELVMERLQLASIRLSDAWVFVVTNGHISGVVVAKTWRNLARE